MNAKSRLTLSDPLSDSSQPGSSVHGISQARTLERVVISFSRDLPDPGIEPESLESPALGGGFFTASCHLRSLDLLVSGKDTVPPLNWLP